MILAAPCAAAEGFAVLVNALGALQGVGLALAVAGGLAVIAFGLVLRAVGSMGGSGESVGRGKKAIITGVTTLALVALFGLIVPTIEAVLGRQVGCPPPPMASVLRLIPENHTRAFGSDLIG